MKGCIPIDIPTKGYIKAYILSQLGPQPVMNSDSVIGSKLYDVLQHRTNEFKKRLTNKRYDTTVRVYVSYHTFYQRGACLNETNLLAFNLFVERQIKWQMRVYLDMFTDSLPAFTQHLPLVRQKLGIDDDAWSDDSMKKDYYRYRQKTNQPLFYTKSGKSFAITP